MHGPGRVHCNGVLRSHIEALYLASCVGLGSAAKPALQRCNAPMSGHGAVIAQMEQGGLPAMAPALPPLLVCCHCLHLLGGLQARSAPWGEDSGQPQGQDPGVVGPDRALLSMRRVQPLSQRGLGC